MSERTVCKAHARNLEALVRAAKNGDLALVECRERSTGKPVAVLCCLDTEEDGETVNIVPFARMFDGNPYEQLDPPNPDGGFYSEEEGKQ
jgi:hypothetical protein